MNLLDRLTADMKAAMKSGDKPRLGTIRMLLSEARTADLQKPPTTPEKMVASHHKKLVKAREEYDKLGKPGEVASLDAEIAVAEEYVPQPAAAGETASLVDAFLAEHADFAKGDIGRATGLFMKQNGGGGVDPRRGQRPHPRGAIGPLTPPP